MKKIILIIIAASFLTSCAQNVKLEGKITEIKYNNTLILEKDYDNVKKLLNTIFSTKDNEKLSNQLIIKTGENLYTYTLSDEYLNYNNYSSPNKKINPYLKKLVAKYTNKDFYTIKYEKNYEQKEETTNISLDKTSNYIILKLDEKVQKFKINALEKSNNEYKDVDLLYSKESLDKGIVTIRKSIVNDTPDIRISFENSYNYKISILPTLDINTEEIKFKTSYKPKENS